MFLNHHDSFASGRSDALAKACGQPGMALRGLPQRSR